MNNILICKKIGIYKEALKRGTKYLVLETDTLKNQIRITENNGRIKWFPSEYFVSDEINVPTLINWEFDDEVPNENSDEFIEVSFNLSDGTKRWCSICTHQGLSKFINKELIWNGLVHITNQIVVKDFKFENVDKALHCLDEQDQLIESSQILED